MPFPINDVTSTSTSAVIINVRGTKYKPQISAFKEHKITLASNNKCSATLPIGIFSNIMSWYTTGKKSWKLQPSMSYHLTNTILQFHNCNNCELLGSQRVISELWVYIYYILHSFKSGTIARWWSVVTETCSYSLIKHSCVGWTMWRFIIELIFFFFTMQRVTWFQDLAHL